MEKISYYWQLAEGVGLSPLVAIGGLACYIAMRSVFGIEKWKALLVVFGVNIIGQIRLAKGWSEWDDVVYLSMIQAFITFGVYSFLEGVRAVEAAEKQIRRLFGLTNGESPKP